MSCKFKLTQSLRSVKWVGMNPRLLVPGAPSKNVSFAALELRRGVFCLNGYLHYVWNSDLSRWDLHKLKASPHFLLKSLSGTIFYCKIPVWPFCTFLWPCSGKYFTNTSAMLLRGSLSTTVNSWKSQIFLGNTSLETGPLIISIMIPWNKIWELTNITEFPWGKEIFQ